MLVTGDNGFPFPRAKATVYQNGCHVPLAVRWGSRCPPGRQVTDDFLYIHNFEPENGDDDVDGSPTRQLIWQGKDDPKLRQYWDLCWGMRPHDELYTAADGPDCITSSAW